ncbi:PhaM family polyhydroxyalkanoate granule multifunctional regulatory protein [Cupriavidus sp. 30B13]|uniref:PhaM family polyhydroxyalkanoate granule multifunctional regulatory protein n=1 Tax=Cupriavidus sp. 30B13 TaxID=3384241 RepID=UPI003B8FE0E1
MFGQIPDFTNGFEFLRKMWGSAAGMPGGLMPGLQAMTPPMDLEELEKRIHDLKAVEGWLQLNVNLLRTTIQGLEVQRATLVALQTFGSALSPEAMQSAMENVARAANAPSAVPPHQRREDHAPAFGARAEPTVEENEDDEDDDSAPAPPEAAPASQDSAQAKGQESAAAPNAGIWWDMLQQQFNQIAASAATASLNPFGSLGGFGMAGAATPAAAPAAPARGKKAAGTARPARKAAARKTGATAKSAAKSAAKSVPKAGTKTAAKPARKAAARRPAATKPAAAPPDAVPEAGGKPDTEPGGDR